MFNKLDHFRTAGAQGAKPPLVESQYDGIPDDSDTHWPSHLCQETGGHGGKHSWNLGAEGWKRSLGWGSTSTTPG